MNGGTREEAPRPCLYPILLVPHSWGLGGQNPIDALTPFLNKHYGLSPHSKCHLLRSYTNDVYAVDTGEARFALKIYGDGWRTPPEIDYEMSLLRHLADAGVAVARPIRPVDGPEDSLVRQITLPDATTRSVVLFEYAPGEKPEPPFSSALYHAFGRAIGQMHQASDDFVTPHFRQRLDLTYLLEASLAVILPHLRDKDDRTYLQSLAAEVTERITDSGAATLDWGPIHGDASLDNLHITADGGIVLYDFDSGGPGYRAMDLQGWAVGDPAFAEKLTAFTEGYSTARILPKADGIAAPLLTIAGDIRGIRIELERRILTQGTEVTQAFLNVQVKQLRQRKTY